MFSALRGALRRGTRVTAGGGTATSAHHIINAKQRRAWRHRRCSKRMLRRTRSARTACLCPLAGAPLAAPGDSPARARKGCCTHAYAPC